MTPRVWTITVPAPGPYMSMNDRDHWRTKAAKVKAWRVRSSHVAAHTVTTTAPGYLCRLPPCTITCAIDVPDKRRRDPHNYYPTIKACVDGMVDAGLWLDDTPEFVTTVEPTFVVVPRGQPRAVVFTLTERT